MMKQLIFGALIWVGVATACPNFSCFADEDKENYVVLSNGVHRCPEFHVCNKLGVDNCQPCISTCNTPYTCKAGGNSTVQNIVVAENREFECPKYTACTTSTNFCNPCVAIKCTGPKNFICTGGVSTDSKCSGLMCKPGYVCNSRWEEPCEACIPEDIPR